MQNYGGWQQRGQGNMGGGLYSLGGPWRDPQMQNNNEPRGYFRGHRGVRGGRARYPYSQQYKQEESYNKTKVKRQPMPQSYTSQPWNKEDAAKALAVETAHMKGLQNRSLLIRFPDPQLNKYIVKDFYPGIENVHFLVQTCPRYCFVQLAENVNPDSAIKELSNIQFGNGKLFVEKKFFKVEEDLKAESIDPYTLYIGNVPTNVNVAAVKEKFPRALRVDVGFAQKMKFTRYAFIRYKSVDDAIEAFKLNNDLLLGSRSLVVRFRRALVPMGFAGESHQQKPSKLEEKAEDNGPMQNYGWQPRGQKNKRGGGGGLWRGSQIPNNQEPRGYSRGRRGSPGGPARYTYGNSQQYTQEETCTKTKVEEQPMSKNSSTSWNKEDAAAAWAVHIKGLKNESLLIRFPDPELTKDIVKTFHPGIETVHFQVSCNPRYCFVQLSENVNPDDAIKELSKIKFGNGNLIVEKEEEDLKPEAIDSYTYLEGSFNK